MAIRPPKSTSMLESMLEYLFSQGSYLAIVIVLAMTGMGLPVPEEVPVVYAGVMSRHGSLEPSIALACCLLGVIGGDCVLYFLGRRFGRRLLKGHHLWSRWMSPEREARIERMIEDHGLKVVLGARFLVGVRGTVFVTAGILKVPFRRFLAVDALSAIVVIGTFFSLSYCFGATLIEWIQHVEVVLTVGVLLGVGVLVFWLWRRRCNRRTSRQSTS